MHVEMPLTLARRLALALGVVVGVIGVAQAETRESGLRHMSAFGIRTNTLGLGVFSDTAWRFPFFRSESPLLRGTYLDLGIVSQLSPATFHPGVFIETVPVAILKLRASAQRAQYFGTFGSLAPFPDHDWSPTAMHRARHHARRGGGYIYDGRAMLRAKAWRIVGSSELDVSRYDLGVDTPVIESVTDLLIEPHDGITQVKSTLGYVIYGQAAHPDSLLVAALHQYFRTDKTDVTRQIVGAAVVWAPSPDVWSTGSPTWAFLAGTFLQDPYRQGRPYLGTLLTMTFAGAER